MIAVAENDPRLRQAAQRVPILGRHGKVFAGESREDLLRGWSRPIDFSLP
jgi:hypothetical protein